MLKTLIKGCEPTRATKYSAFVDLYASEDVVIEAGETKIVGLGVCVDLEYIRKLNKIKQHPFFVKTKSDEELSEERYISFLKSHYLQLKPRSSLRAKGLVAGTEIVNLNYKDEIKIILHNPVKLVDVSLENYAPTYAINNNSSYVIKKGDCIAQISLMGHKSYLIGINSD